jgi:NADH-quinone oxidoreductase subunit A
MAGEALLCPQYSIGGTGAAIGQTDAAHNTLFNLTQSSRGGYNAKAAQSVQPPHCAIRSCARGVAMLTGYVPILVLFLVALFIAVFVIALSSVLGPKRLTRRKLMPYESGMEPIGEAQGRFDVRFYRVAMLFILFDIEIVFFFPFALVYRQLGLFGLVEMGLFVLILLAGFVYVWKAGALKWV